MEVIPMIMGKVFIFIMIQVICTAAWTGLFGGFKSRLIGNLQILIFKTSCMVWVLLLALYGFSFIVGG